MKRFFGFSLGILILAVSLTVGTRVIGAGNPTFSFSALFTNPDGSKCQPLCVLGVRPGTTRIEDLHAILSAHPVVHHAGTYAFSKASMEQVTFGTRARGITVQFIATLEGLVDYIHLDYVGSGAETNLKSPTLGELIQTFGSPDMVLECVGGRVLIYREAGLELYVPALVGLEARYMFSEPIDQFMVFKMQKCPRFTTTNSITSWLGFTTEGHYRFAALKSLRVTASGFGAMPLACIG